MSVYRASFPKPIKITTTELYDGAASAWGFGAVNSQVLTLQTCLAYIFPTGSGEGGFGDIISKDASSGRGIRFLVDHNSGSPRIAAAASSDGSTGNPTCTASTGLTYSQWAHVAYTYSNGLASANFSLFQGLNGAIINQLSTSGVDGNGALSLGPTNSFVIGNRVDGDRTFKGTIAYAARWNRILSLSELRTAQQYGPLSIPQGLVLCWSGGRDYSPIKLKAQSISVVYQVGQVPPNLLLGKTLQNVYFSVTAATGRIFKLAGFGGGLVGESHGLAG